MTFTETTTLGASCRYMYLMTLKINKMKTTPEYLYDFAMELSERIDINTHGKMTPYQIMAVITELCQEYGTLIDAVKELKKDK